MKKSLISLVLPLLLASGCGKQSTPTVAQLSPEDIVIANSYTVQEAVEAFALQNAGRYPRNVDSDTTQSGKTLKDFLPGGLLLTNPFTGARTEPLAAYADLQGQTGYAFNADSVYTITGFGRDSLVIILSLRSPGDIQTMRNCYTVQRAVAAFAADNNGEYPANVNSDTNLSGNTVIDLLPSGTRLENPFTKLASEPVNSAATTAGQTGYTPTTDGVVFDGYSITSHGERTLIIFLWR